jgi:PelA/Pel-15E family pectate lyase
MLKLSPSKFIPLICCLLTASFGWHVTAADATSEKEVAAAMMKAGRFYLQEVASHGGYVYFYSLDLQQRWGEGVASKDQVWVQPPGTPTVGMAYLKAYQATGDSLYLKAATAAAEALVYGQMESGGWTNCIDFEPRGERVALYRNGKGSGRNTSSLDDGQTQSAIRLLIQVDRELEFRNKQIHEAASFALQSLLNEQFANGAFPQVWDGDAVDHRQKVVQASYPDYDWKTEGRIKNYWDMYTLNDNVTGYVTDTLLEAHQTYKDDRYLQALKKLGDFLVIAQMPEPQPGWAQQYNYDMQPIWARKFEPPGVSGDESQEVIQTLMKIAAATGDKKFLEPIPAAVMYLQRSLLNDGQLARYYELETNKPLYMERGGKNYRLTHDDSNLPTHYGWKTDARLDELREQYSRAKTGDAEPPSFVAEQDVRNIIADLDQQGRWVSTYNGDRLVGQAKMAIGAKYLSSERFSENLTTLSQYSLQLRIAGK